MKNRLSPLLILMFSLMPLYLLAQELEDYAPKAPEAMVMDKFVDIPPGSYTGVAGYSVPLYTIQVDGYSIPITINYHGMGIKVNEVASSVGLGWSLSVGGISLSREVVGEDDQATTQLDIDVTNFHPQHGQADYLDAANMARVGRATFQTTISELQPDYYSYRLLNNSGKFIMDNDGVGQTIPKDDIKIIDGTTLIDNQGIKYLFGFQHENLSVTGSEGSMSGTKIPSYRLDQIIFPSGKIVDFAYINSTHSYISGHNESRQVLEGLPSGDCTAIVDNVSRIVYNMDEKLLSQITYDNAEINFNYATQERQDIGGKKLNNITVNSSIGGAIKTIRDYIINTSYWVSSGPPATDIYIPPTDPLYDGLVKRLRLDSLEETLSGKTYSFDYYDYLGQELPYRLSKDTDFWGKYNSKNNKEYIHQYTYNDINGDLRVEEGADKSPDINYAQIASLKTVHLPTGGSQEFEYELDDYKLDAIENQFYKDSLYIPVTPSTVFNQSFALNMPSNYWDGFDYKLEFYWQYNNTSSPNLPNPPYYSIELTDQNGAEVQTLYHNMAVDLDPLSQNKTYYLNFVRMGNPIQGEIWAKISWYQNNDIYLANKKAGNLRTSSITLRDSDNSIALKRDFSYVRPSEPQFSSGVFRDFPKYLITESPGGNNGTYCTYKNYSNNYEVNTSTFKGKSVVYEYVKEEFVNPDDPLENHHTLQQFSLPSFQGQPQPNALPKPPLVDYSYTGGLLLNSQAVSSNNEKLSETINVYSFDDHFNADSYNSQLGGVPSNAVSSGVVISQKSKYLQGGMQTFSFNWNYYFIPSTWVKLLESTTKTYFDNNVVEQKVMYDYDDDSSNDYKHIKHVFETTHTSLGDEIRTEFTYPQDLSEPHSFDLSIANRVADPLVTSSQKKINGSWENISEQKTIYEDWGNGIIEPKTIQTAKDTETLKNRIEFYDYDAFGNPLELSRTDGMDICYIYGYDKTLPVAKIENATYSQISSYVSNIQIHSNSDDDRTIDIVNSNGSKTYIGEEGDLREVLDNLRNSLPNAMVSTYTYDPLIGVTSMTDPKGYTVYYEYDSSGRLLRVKDEDGKVMSENAYHYKQ
ncbi:RHS repeat domain-containing protein [Winogradskyella flava]|uniref:RHS repeat protein n=1 Tax=Winogradskyella flava TaxID=1884876 RepID=A0A842IS53_9FLAO|nr:RHS repeat domain-containing protein [Winogradskyella flava]MBC2844624.1 RHS repeat protein [Winogradskyella flava]